MAPRTTVKIKCVEAILTSEGDFAPTGGPMADGVYEVSGTLGRKLTHAHPKYLLDIG